MPDSPGNGRLAGGSRLPGRIDRLPARRAAPLAIVVLDEDAEVRHLVAERVAVDPQGPGGTAEVAPIGLQRGDDELPFEFPPGLLQGQAAAYELVDDLVQASVEVLVSQNRCPRKTGKIQNSTGAAQGTGTSPGKGGGPCPNVTTSGPAWIDFSPAISARSDRPRRRRS